MFQKTRVPWWKNPANHFPGGAATARYFENGTGSCDDGTVAWLCLEKFATFMWKLNGLERNSLICPGECHFGCFSEIQINAKFTQPT